MARAKSKIMEAVKLPSTPLWTLVDGSGNTLDDNPAQGNSKEVAALEFIYRQGWDIRKANDGSS